MKYLYLIIILIFLQGCETISWIKYGDTGRPPGYYEYEGELDAR